MNYSDGEFSVELPVFDKRMEALDASIREAGIGGEEAHKRMYNFIRKCLPNKVYLDEKLNGKTFASIDLIQLQVVYGQIKDAYEKPLRDMEKARLDTELANYDKLFQIIDKANNAKKLQEAFKMVK